MTTRTIYVVQRCYGYEAGSVEAAEAYDDETAAETRRLQMETDERERVRVDGLDVSDSFWVEAVELAEAERPMFFSNIREAISVFRAWRDGRG